ncbi:hypothetical protein KXW98_001951 [Aspergillus fumigatus]|nr:hypothetical protein KXX38_005463 [Aspergillus fumigatus]KAH1333520.1 hypothetical protein KXX47_009039 [Aspergillus fumigatus]KAH1381773.1 hypothetical protein KXX50_007094 [Aspergillus fumigatus]KAH1432581.1 hypothetical protein KXX22_004984 [Aspergillus fumigatus]KAH1744476.1 hypothetical protein KXX09_008834 [Aspergillus fumigatus]
MRVSTLLPLALAAGTAAASKNGTLGFALGNKNEGGKCKVQSDYETDFDTLKEVTSLVRIYSASDCDTAKHIIPAAKAKNFKVVLGVWPDYDKSFTDDFNALKEAVPGNEEVIDAITVGSEVLYRKSLTPQALLARIQQVQKEFPKITVGMVDSWNKFADGTADPIIQGGVTYFLANGFAYWQGQELSNATNTYFDDMAQALGHIEQVAGSNADKIRFGNGETGWPTTGGTNYGPAVASTANAADYYKSAVCGMLAWGVDVFYFEAFDESWKPKTKGDNGEMQDETHWGAFTADHPLVSSANSASCPPPFILIPNDNPDNSHSTVPLVPSYASPKVSNRSASRSPGPQQPPRTNSVTPNPPATALPTLPKLRGAWESSTSSPDNREKESSVYYTTAWGSPYAAPSPRRLSWSLSQFAGIDRASGDSSPASMRSGIHHDPEINNTDLLKPSAAETSARHLYSNLLSHSPGRDLLSRKGGKSIKDFTQDWINQYLSGQPRTERSNWLSDDSGSEAPSFFTAQNHFADDASDDWLGLEEDRPGEDLLRTPTLADFVSRRALAANGENSLGRPKLKDSLHKRTDTLRQEDFWGFAYDKDPQSLTMTELKDTQHSAEMETGKAPSPAEKPLPPPPPADADSEPQSLSHPSESSSTPVPVKKPALDKELPTPTPTPRPRKKLVWRGKACIIAIPVDDKRGTEESGYRLLSVEDVQQRLRQWEDEGYDIRGFTVGAPEDLSDLELGGLSRRPFPDSRDVQEEREAGKYTVSIPDKAEWDAYVSWLQEEKLRALGVSLGDEEMPPSISPASAALSQMAPFPGLIASPPIPTASATSNPLSIPHHFSPHFNQSANVSNGIGSLASPASQFSVQTPFFGVEQNLLPGYLPFQPTPPAQGALTPQGFFNVRQGNVTSTIGGNLPNLTSIMSPVSPLHDQGAFHPGLEELSLPSKDSQHGHSDHGPQEAVPGGTHPRAETPDHFHASNVEIAQPTPRGHSRGHNLSETLQKGLDQVGPSDYHLEESIERQLDEDDREPIRNNLHNSELFHSRWALPDNDHHGMQRVPQHLQQFYGENYVQVHANEGSDIDTNPSLSGAPQGHGSLTNNIPWHEPKPSSGSFVGGHKSKLSTSTLNVEAREFDPSGASTAQNYPPQGSAFQFSGMGGPAFTFEAGANFIPAGGFNVAAPAFNPAGNLGPSTSAQFSAGRAKIFGDIDLSQITKPPKKSKAIPIVRPDDNAQDNKNKANAEDDHGRVSADRHKRVRRGQSLEGDAQYAVPSHPLTETTNAQGSKASNVPRDVPAEGKENEVPGQIAHGLNQKEAVDEEKKSVERNDTPVSEASTWTPFDTKEERADVQPESQEQKQEGDKATQKPAPSVAGAAVNDEAPTKKTAETSAKSSFLKPTAKPFEFKPAVPEFVPTVFEQPTSAPAPAPEKPRNDLMASRYAVASRPASPKRDSVPSESAEPVAHAADDVPTVAADVPEDDLSGPVSEVDSPNDEELNAVMEQLNDGSDVGIERLSTPRPAYQPPESALEPSKEKRHVHADIRSEAPSPSPGRGPVVQALEVPKLDFDADSQASMSPSRGVIGGSHSPVRQLISRNEHISDWDDVISSGEDEKLVNRSRFFDRRVNDLIGSVLEERLLPLERALEAIQESVTMVTAGAHEKWLSRSVSAQIEESDADDEDDEYDEHGSYRARSPFARRDRKLERLKNVILEALATREQQQLPEPTENPELTKLHDMVMELHSLTAQKFSEDPMANLREMMQEVVSSQLVQYQPRPSDAEEIGADSLMLQIDGLKNMLRLTDERAEQEYKLRREAQDSVAELQRLLKLAEEEAARHSEAAESAEARLLQFKEEKIPYFEQIQFRFDTLEQEHATLKLTLAEVSSKNISLEGTLDEYRFSSDNWKRESDQAKSELEKTKAENEKLRGTIDHLKTRIEDGLSIRQNLSEKFDRLQDEMVAVTRDITRDQALWRRREEEHIAKYNELRTAYSREVKLREKLENDISELEQQEREAAKLKFIFGQSQQENARLEELVANLRLENHELQNKAARYEREFNEARETSRTEIQRTRTYLEADLEAANSQVNIVRAELEAQIIRLQSQLDNVRLDTDTARERYELLLEEASETKASALAAAAEAKERAMEEQRRTHERVLNDLRERHARALHNSTEDRQRAESHLMERLALADDKVHHLEDRVKHLEEKLEIANAAARAAAEAAQTVKAESSQSPVAHLTSPSMTFSKNSMVPEKISPQALRESILVLQDQLQQREARIEELEQELSGVDKDAPNKLKEKDTEITWLRELLGVRIDDLQDIINTLSSPSFNQHAVRDAAIRLKANLQMQLQERERAQSGQNFPSLPRLADLAASPRSLPLAAAAAWGNWRKGRENANSASEQTPSKSSNAGSFLSGLLTPPSSNFRQAPSNPGGAATTGWRRSSETRPLSNINTTPRPLSSRQTASLPEPPSTPPLLRRASYDHDAEPADYADASFGEDVESTADGLVSASPKGTEEGPFGPHLTS